jgi:DNA primase
MNDVYTKSDIRSILNALNLKIESETGQHFLCLCPFHANRNSPSFEVDYNKGLYFCFNPSCDARGTLNDLVKETTHRNDFETIRFILAHRQSSSDVSDELSELLDEKPDFESFPEETLAKLHNELLNNKNAMSYFYSRGINDTSISSFNLGYSENQGMVTVPLTAPDGLAVGIIGRSIEGKTFKNSQNLPRNKTLFNLSSAKKHGGKIIVCESSFDAILIAQAGFPNVVATLGAHLSKEQIQLLNRYASTIIIMTDNDEAGRKLGHNIANRLSNKNILWSSYDYDMIYPHDAKDAGELTPDEIRTCIINAVPHYEYALTASA